MSHTPLSEAEEELVGIYSERLATYYAKGRLDVADEYADKILRYLPEDLFATFVKGAVIGRSTRADDLHIAEAFAYWRPAMQRFEGDDRAALQEAIRAAFSIMTDTPLELGRRRWSAYLDFDAIRSLADVLESYLALPDVLVESEEDAWIVPLIDENRAHWVATVIEVNVMVPSGKNTALLDAFYDFAHAAYEHAKQIPVPMNDSVRRIKERSFKVLEQFEVLNGSPEHPERRAYLAQEREVSSLLA
jgi:hypothetical protein